MSAALPGQPARGYRARLEEQLYSCGPLSWPSLLASSADIAAARALLARAAAAAPAAASIAPPPAALTAARRLCAATLHPDTGEPIALPLRMAAHVPVNTVLLVGMLSAATPLAVGAWQLANQSFNALQFFANRNASNAVSDATLAASFSGAVAAALAVGVGASAWADARAAAGSAAARHLRLAVPFLAAAAAKPLQIGLLRQDEWRDGVLVRDGDGAPRGRSAAAGRWALAATVATRTLYLTPMLLLPYAHAAAVAALPRAVPPLATYVALAAAASALATPACMALFEQEASLPAAALEPPLRALRDAAGRPVETLYFNKGL